MYTIPGRQPVYQAEVPKPARSKWRIIRRTLLILLIVVILIGGWVAWSFVNNEVRVFGWRGLWGLVVPEKLRGEDVGRVNILLAGNSRDDPGHQGANLTDSIMILSLNTRDHTGVMLSIPRDLYVKLPDGYAKINAAYDQGGMPLLKQTVSEVTGLPISYDALVDYSALRQAVDAVGGVDVSVNSSDPRGLYDPSPDLSNNYQPLVDLRNGTDHLNGTQALGLARARGDAYGSYGYAGGDFTRTANQRLLILALKQKSTRASTIANPIKLNQLFNALGQNVQTDMSFGNVHRLYNLSKATPGGKITSVGLSDENQLRSTYIYGSYVLLPIDGLDDYTDVQIYVSQLLAK